MRVMVTGGAGFIGSHVVDALLQAGHSVLVLDNLSSGIAGQVRREAQLSVRDILDHGEWQLAAFDFGCQAIIHLAAQVSVARSVQDPYLDAKENILGSLSVLQAGRELGVQKVVFASSAAVYGDPTCIPITEEHPTTPTSPYGIAKLSVENYLRAYASLFSLDFTVLRFSNVYGPRQNAHGEAGVVSAFAERLATGKPPVIHGDGEQTRDFVFVRDVARAVVSALTRGSGATLNIGTGHQVKINEVCSILTGKFGSDVPPMMDSARPGDIRHSCLDPTRAFEELGWKAEVELREGLGQTAEWVAQSVSKRQVAAVLEQ